MTLNCTNTVSMGGHLVTDRVAFKPRSLFLARLFPVFHGSRSSIRVDNDFGGCVNCPDNNYQTRLGRKTTQIEPPLGIGLPDLRNASTSIDDNGPFKWHKSLRC